MLKFHNLFTYTDGYGCDGSVMYTGCVALVDLGLVTRGTKFHSAVLHNETTLRLFDINGALLSAIDVDIVRQNEVYDKVDDLVYLAGPWFHPGQRERLEGVQALLLSQGLKVFSPKDEILFEKGKTTAYDILRANVAGIMQSQFLVVITDGKDVGTMFEAGYACRADVPIVYFWEEGEEATKRGVKFNVMLAATGAIATNWTDLETQIEHWRNTGYFSGTVEALELE